MKYVVQPGYYQETLALNLLPGSYHAEWIDPASGKLLSEAAIQHPGGACDLITPPYTVDVALRIIAR